MATKPYRANSVKLFPQSSNPFGVGEDGIYADNTNAIKFVSNGNVLSLVVEATVSTTGGLTSGLAGQLGVGGRAVTQSTLEEWKTFDGVNWSALS